MDTHTPLALVLSAPPGAPGVLSLLDRAGAEADAGRDVRVLLSADGLAWAGQEHRPAWFEGVDVAVCSRNAGDQGWTHESTPEGVRWSSVGTWLAELDGAGRAALWVALP